MSRPGAAARAGAETPMPRTLGALETYLAEDRDFRGIGPDKAAALAAAFGDGLHAALDCKHPEVIAILGEETATNAFAAYELKSPEIELLDWLETPPMLLQVDAELQDEQHYRPHELPLRIDVKDR